MAATEWAWRVLSAGILFSTTACQPMADVPLSQNELTTSTEDASCLLYTSPSPRDRG